MRPDAPAAKAGLKKGDRVVEIDGKPIRTQTDLRFALGPRYGGDRVKLGIERGSERLDREIELIGELPEFRHGFLGILPLRPAGQVDKAAEPNPEKPNASDDAGDKASEEKDEESAANDDDEPDSANADDEKPSDGERGVAVRMVYGGSPAEQAGLQAGDRIIKINDAAVGTIAEAIVELNNAAPGSEVALQYVRAGKPMDLKLTASRLPTSVPAELPAAYEPRELTTGSQPADAAKPEPAADGKGEASELKLPEFPQQCQIYLPAMHDDGRALGLLLWLHAPGKANAEEVVRDWQAICDRDGLILVIPTSAEEDRWDRTELEYLGRLVERVVGQHKVDPHRVVVYGEAGGGAMAWLLGVSGRQIIRGVATSGAPLPRQLMVPSNEPMQRLTIFAAIPSDSDASVQIAQGLQKFSEAGYPVTTLTGANAGGKLSASQREELARWIDTLDRF